MLDDLDTHIPEIWEQLPSSITIYSVVKSSLLIFIHEYHSLNLNRLTLLNAHGDFSQCLGVVGLASTSILSRFWVWSHKNIDSFRQCFRGRTPYTCPKNHMSQEKLQNLMNYSRIWLRKNFCTNLIRKLIVVSNTTIFRN